MASLVSRDDIRLINLGMTLPDRMTQLWDFIAEEFRRGDRSGPPLSGDVGLALERYREIENAFMALVRRFYPRGRGGTGSFLHPPCPVFADRNRRRTRR